MDEDATSQFHSLMIKADTYHRKAQWQEKLRALQSALSYCGMLNFPECDQYKQQVLFEMGGIRRRFGQYDQAIETLEQAMASYEDAGPILRATILGELGVVYRHKNDFFMAQKVFSDQLHLAGSVATLDADAQICRALGNGGMSAYNLSQQKEPHDQDLLQTALVQLNDSITRARDLRRRLLRENSQSKYIGLSNVWETISLNRLSLCYVAAGDTREAVRRAEESQRVQTTDDPTVKAFSRFFYGNALWHNDQHDEALRQWNAPPGMCTSIMALCKEPSTEHTDYLKLLIEAGVAFDSYDEQGFSALDYAVLAHNDDAKQMVDVLVDAARNLLRQRLSISDPQLGKLEREKRVENEIAIRLRQSLLRRHYREVLQEHIRPLLRISNPDSVHKLRNLYKKLLAEDQHTREIFDDFDYVKYSTFQAHRKIPRSFEKLSNRFQRQSPKNTDENEDDFVIFISYRWLGGASKPPLEGPDDRYDTQWRRMMSAVDELLAIKGNNISQDRVSLWLDCTCIDQVQPERMERGIDSLPLAVTQCDAMISLVDEEYYERAWCAVEVMLMRELIDSYGIHEWWEHVLHSPKTDRLSGYLKRGTSRDNIDVGALKLTKEKEDRPRIDFLIRQSKLLGNDRA